MHEESLKLWRSRIALNLVSPNKTMRFFLPQDKRSRNVRKRDEGSMLFTRTSILYTQESARVRSRFLWKVLSNDYFHPEKEMFFVSPQVKRRRLNVNSCSLGIGIWTEKTLNFKKWLIGNLPERSIKIRTDRRVMNYQYSTRISNMANTSRAIASKINTQY